MSKKPTLLIDFDGVLHDYKGWNGEQPTGGPIPRARAAMCNLETQYTLVCFTTRPYGFVKAWLLNHGFPTMRITNIKEPAVLILDDRAMTFTGEWNNELLERIKSFKAYWEQPNEPDHLPLPDAPQVTRP